MKRIFHKLSNTLNWTRDSLIMLIGFLITVSAIAAIWWELYLEVLDYIRTTGIHWTEFIDWLLIGIFIAMSLLITSGADLKKDIWIVLIGLGGGLVIESWGTQTELWTYYTNERPPLWIIPAWPVASLSIDRLVHLIEKRWPTTAQRETRLLYWLTFVGFYALMLAFVMPTIDRALTVLALIMCALFIIKPVDTRLMIITFVAGSGFGYFLEVWGTTRLTWTYYTQQTPPFFAVLAHGMAAVAFWRTALLVKLVLEKWIPTLTIPVRENMAPQSPKPEVAPQPASGLK